LATFTLHIKRKEKKITILRFLILLNASLGLHKYLLSISSGELLARGIVMKNEKNTAERLFSNIYVNETSDQNNSKLDESNLYPENACQMSS
jgi:hypothetical protein